MWDVMSDRDDVMSDNMTREYVVSDNMMGRYMCVCDQGYIYTNLVG